ncbi:MAG TPA: hypothetical protein VEX88_01135 [Glaciibacter sp.]|nr:hypothetical protein [Glaciibacter sp.]
MAAEADREYQSHDWDAWYNRQPGADDRRLYVAGKVDLPSSSIVPFLEFRPDGIVDEPDLVTLRLIVHVPEIGDDRFVTKDVSWSQDVGQDIKRVRIIGSDVPDVIKVQIVQ